MEKLKATFLRLANSHPNKPLTSSQISLLQDKLLSVFPHLHTPTHPTYTVMIENAINNLDEVNGSTEESISKYIKSYYDDLPWAHTTYLRHHLNKLCEDGDIVVNSTSTSKYYTTYARAVVGYDNSRGKQRPRVFVTFRRERKECGVDEGDKDVIEVSETSLMSRNSEVKRRKRCLVQEDDDDGVKGDANVGGEQCQQNGDMFIKEGNEDANGIVPSTVIVLNEVTSERGNVDEDGTNFGKLLIVPVESVDKPSSTLNGGGDDYCVIEQESNLKECERMIVPFVRNSGLSEICERNWPVVICGLEELSKQKYLVYSRKRFKDRQGMKKISSASTPKRYKISQVNKKLSPVSKPSSSALAVSDNVVVLNHILKDFLSQRRPETKEFPQFTELPVDQNQHACGLGDGSIEHLESCEYLDPLRSSSLQEPNSMVDEENLPLKKMLKSSKQKKHTLQKATVNVSLATVAPSNSISKLQLDLPIETPARMTPVMVPDLLLTERERSSQPEANSIPLETGSVVYLIDKTNGELETDGGAPQDGHKKDGQGGPQENLVVNKGDEEASLNSLLEPQDELSELAMSLNSLEKVNLLEKGGRGRSQKLLESSPEQKFKMLRTEGRGRSRKPIEVAKENAASSLKLDIGLQARPSGPATQLISLMKGRKRKKDSLGRPGKKIEETNIKDPATSYNLHLGEIQHLKKDGRSRLRRQKQVNKEDLTGLPDSMNAVHRLEGVPDQEKEWKVEVYEQSEVEVQVPNLNDGFHVAELEISQSEIVGICKTQLGVSLSDDDKQDSLTAQEQNELQHCPKHEIKQESKLLKKAGRGRPRKQKQVEREDSGGPSDPLDVNYELKDGLADQERDLKGNVRKQSENEAQKPDLSDGSRAESEKSQSEVFEVCETQLTVPLADDDKLGYELALEQEEVQHCHEHKKNQGKFEGQGGLSKIKLDKVIVSSKYPLRSRMNNQSLDPLSSKHQ